MQTSWRVTQFRESVIRDMTRLAIQHNAINLSQGFPDFGTEPTILDAAAAALRDGLNQYTITWGYPPLRQKLAELYSDRLGWAVHPDRHVTVTCGVTEAIVISMMAVLNPGDEVIIFEPAHDNFRPAAYMASAVPVSIPLVAPDYRITPEKVAAAITPKTRALLLNTPHNPTGRVWDTAELQTITDIVLKHDLVLLTDEIYDRILYDGRAHLSPGSLPTLRDRTITISGLGKTFAVTGWRLGYVVAPDVLMQAIRPLHDFTSICAPTPLQAAGAAALSLPPSYYQASTAAYHERRTLMMDILLNSGFRAEPPQGAYYIMADYSGLPIPQAQLSPVAFAHWFTTEVGVAVVPGDSFYSSPGYGGGTVRFAFPKKQETLREAGRRIAEKLAR
jgi:aminotransferase